MRTARASTAAGEKKKVKSGTIRKSKEKKIPLYCPPQLWALLGLANPPVDYGCQRYSTRCMKNVTKVTHARRVASELAPDLFLASALIPRCLSPQPLVPWSKSVLLQGCGYFSCCSSRASSQRWRQIKTPVALFPSGLLTTVMTGMSVCCGNIHTSSAAQFVGAARSKLKK